MPNIEVNAKYAEKYGWHDELQYTHVTQVGLTESTVREISAVKKEPKWMLDFRLSALKIFEQKAMPKWGADLSDIDFQKTIYYMRPSDKKTGNWEDVPESIKKTFDKLGIPEAERKFLAGVGAQYDCVTADTKIPTNPDGLKQISEIKVGDYVFALNEKTKSIEKKKVLAVLNKGTRPVFEVKVAGRSIKATYNHPLLALVHNKKPGKRRGRYKQEWKYLNELKTGDLIAVAKRLPIQGSSHKLEKPIIDAKVNIMNQFGATHKHDLQHLYKNAMLPEQTNEDLMWLFGLFIGDGWLDKNGKRLSFAIPDSESELRDELKAAIERLFKIEASNENEYKITVHSKLVHQFFAINGFKGNAKTKTLPKWIYKLPQNELLAFLGGYLDSDGTVRLDKKCHDAVLTSVNESLLEDLRAIIFYVGLQCSKVTTFKQKDAFDKTTERTAHRLHISGNLKTIKSRNPHCFSRFGQAKYVHDFTSAKNTTFRQHVTDDLGFAKVESIKFLGEEKVFDITVEDHHNFIAEGVIVHNSEVVYHKIREDLEKKGVIFTDTDSALQKYPDIFKKHFGTVVPPGDNKFAALNSAVWSGGSFLYVPAGVHVDIPLQAYFRINAKNVGQFERTLIIAEEGSSVHYIEGCSAPSYSQDSLHAAVVEVIAKKGAKVRYTTIQNWSNNVYNLVTKRAHAHERATVEWLDGNLGSKVTMKYPSVMLLGPDSKAEILSIAYAGNGMNQDAGSKVFHFAPRTTSRILSKSLSKNGGKSVFRGLVRIAKGATGSQAHMKCDALILDKQSKSDTIPSLEIGEEDSKAGHEATCSRINEDQLFYLASRGLSPDAARNALVLGFVAPFTKELPMEYAIELNRLITLEMEGNG